MSRKKRKYPEPLHSGALSIADAMEFKKDAEAWGREVCKSPETARQALYEMGMITRTGKLTKRYSGK